MELEVFIEIPRGSANKYEYDKKRRVFKLDRILFSSVHYPCDYGFIPDTLALDGDPLDVLVIISQPTFPGCLMDVRVVGMCDMEDEKGQDEKILCVSKTDPRWNHIKSFEDVPPHILKEVEHFFSVYKDLEKGETSIKGWVSGDKVETVIKEAFDRYEGEPMLPANH